MKKSIAKKIFGAVLLSTLTLTSTAQVTDVTIGATVPSNWMIDAPNNHFYSYSWSSTLYMASDLGASGVITQLGFFNDKAHTASQQKIYIRHTPAFFQTGSDYPNPAGNPAFTLVYDGTINYVDGLASPGTPTVVALTTPFFYNGNENIEIVFENHSGTSFPASMYYYGNPNVDYRTKSDYSNSGFPSSFQNGSIVNNFPTIRFTIDTDINCVPLGIGTQAPNAMLDIRSCIPGKPAIFMDGFVHSEGDISWTPGQDLELGTWDANETEFDQKMVIGANGSVGIGTIGVPASQYKLAVSGTIRAKKIIVNTDWADFVFEEDYRLPPLEEIEDFVKKNHHLPGIPTASEIEKNGVTLGEIEAQLLQKIEELTLYTIEQEKRINKLTEQVEKLSKK